MKTTVYLIGAIKFAAGFVLTVLFRSVTPYLGLSNVSPLMATQLAGGKAYGPWAAGLYGALSMMLIDLLMGKVGQWTVITSITYAAVGVWGAYFLKGKKGNSRDFVLASIVGTLFFDLVTGVLMGPLMFGQSWAAAIVGQIPFTFRHLVGNMFFAIVLAPWFYRKIMSNLALEVRFGLSKA